MPSVLNKGIIALGGLLSFSVSMFLLGIYTEGDYIDYSNAYEAIYDQTFVRAFLSYRGLIGSSEPIHFTISWIASNLEFSRTYFISICNSFTTVAFLVLGRKLNASLFVLIIIAFSNLYFFALFTELERLKFAFLFFFISMYFFENKKIFYVFSIITVLTHLQFLVIYSGFLALYFSSQIKHIFVRYRVQTSAIFIIIISTVIVVIMYDHLAAKISAHYIGLNYLHLLKALLFLILILFYSRNRKQSFIFILPLFFMILLVGGNRLIIFAYFIFLYYALQNRRGYNLGILLTTFYYSVTGAIFIFNVFDYGRGYAQP